MSDLPTMTTETIQSARLSGPGLRMARGQWFAMAAFTVFLFIAGLPRSFQIGLQLLPDSARARRCYNFLSVIQSSAAYTANRFYAI
jgi:hypothetical protein